jgi:hypothetical protein
LGGGSVTSSHERADGLFFFTRPGFELWEFVLAKQVVCHLSHTSSSFCFGYFGDGSGGGGGGYLRNKFPGLSSNLKASQVARITGVSHQCPEWYPECHGSWRMEVKTVWG